MPADEPPRIRPARRLEDRWSTWDKRVRDAGIYAVGISGAVNELFFRDEPRPTALVFIASMVGLPLVLRADERRRGEREPHEM